MAGENFRIERDSMGEVKVPSEAYYGAQTQRAVENFPVSGIGFPRQFIRALATVKYAAASANEELGLLDPRLAALFDKPLTRSWKESSTINLSSIFFRPAPARRPT